MIRLSGLWKNTGKNGASYLKGKLSPVASLLVFPNDHKRNDNDPDYYIYLDESKRQQETENAKPEAATF